MITKEYQNNGAITVYLAIVFIFIMAMLGTLIDGARLAEAHTQVYYATDLAATSALAEFNTQLKDRYGLFAYQGNPEETIQKVVAQNLNSLQNGELSESEELYNYIYDTVLGALGGSDPVRNQPFDLLHLGDVNITQKGSPETLLNKNEFERQIFEYIKFRGPVELFTGDYTIQFGEITSEIEKAENEDIVDQIIEKIEVMLAGHVEDQGKYNEKGLKPFREKMKDIQENQYLPIIVELMEESSLEGLGILSGLMRNLSSALVVNEDCKALMAQLEELEENRKEILEQIEQMEKRFSGEGDTAKFDSKPISGEMLQNYLNDLSEYRNRAQFYWEKETEIKKEIQKYKQIQQSTSEIKTSISDYQEKIATLQIEAEELEELEENSNSDSEDNDSEEEDNLEERKRKLEEKIKALWAELDSHFNGALYMQGSGGIFYNVENLLKFIAYPGKDSISSIKANDLTQEANKSLEKKIKRNYQKIIPDSYTLPSGIKGPEVNQELKLDLDGNLNIKNIDAVTKKREHNRQSAGGVKNLFSGVDDFVLDTFDNAMLGLYAIGNFQNALCFEGKKPAGYQHEDKSEIVAKYSQNMRNDSIQDIFFDDCEIEYLIKGNKQEIKNYEGIRNELTGLYFILNYTCIRRAPNIRGIVEGISRAVETTVTAVTLGVGSGAAVIAYYATREACYNALAGIQTSHDLERLYQGSKVPLLKKSDGDFCGVYTLLGINGICSDDVGPSKIPIGYVDYLFIRMILTGQNQLRGRLQDLVEMNMNVQGDNLDTSQPFQLAKAKTSVNVNVEAKMPFFFINVLFMAENYDGVEMNISKSASHKY